MFTGIIDHQGSIADIQTTLNRRCYRIAHQFGELQLGESISVNGACLTVTAQTPGFFSCDISPETLSCTNLGELAIDDAVNLERSLRLEDRLGGHLVSGHVDQTLRVAVADFDGEYLKLVFKGLNTDVAKLVFPKGSICINGVSLTVNHCDEDGFDVLLIPTTQSLTNLSDVTTGDNVNIEFDQMAKMVVNTVERMKTCHSNNA